MVDGTPIHTRLWCACDAVVCTPISIADTDMEVPHMKCALGHCKDCGTINAPQIELASNYSVVCSGFESHKECSVHGIDHLKEYDMKPKLSCELCNVMTELEKRKWKAKRKTPKIIKKRLRRKYVLPMKEFMKHGGVYEKQARKRRTTKHI